MPASLAAGMRAIVSSMCQSRQLNCGTCDNRRQRNVSIGLVGVDETSHQLEAVPCDLEALLTQHVD